MEKETFINLTENSLKNALKNIDEFKKSQYETDLTNLIKRIDDLEKIMLEVKRVLI